MINDDMNQPPLMQTPKEDQRAWYQSIRTKRGLTIRDSLILIAACLLLVIIGAMIEHLMRNQ